MVLEKTLESPLDCKEIQPVHSKGDQPWGFIGRADATKIMASGPITSWEIDGKQCQTLFWGAPKSLQKVIAAMKLKDAYSLEGKL